MDHVAPLCYGHQEVLEFWLDRGVDGFRVDAIASLYEASNLEQDEPRSGHPTAKPVSTGIMDCDAARVFRRSVW